MNRSAILAVALVACGTARAGSQLLSYEARDVHVGHSSADILAYDDDGDGALDIVVSGGGRVVVLRGDGAGRFEVARSVEAGERPVDIALGDVDEDGHVDVVVANHETTHLTLLLGGPGGPGSGASRRLGVDVSPHPHAVALADLNEDGHLDILFDDRDRERIQVLAGAGDGSFEAAAPVAVGGDPYRGMTVADVDGDGHLDVVTPNPRTVAVQLGDGDGGFTRGPVLDSRTVPPFSVAVADFDGDGVVDIAAGSGEGPGAVMVWRGEGGGSFVPAPGAPFEIAEGPTKLVAADADGDGTADLVVTSYVGDEVAVILGGEELRLVRIAVDGSPWGVAAGDLDGDGGTDLMIANDGAPTVTVLLRRSGGRDGRETSPP